MGTILDRDASPGPSGGGEKENRLFVVLGENEIGAIKLL